MPGKMVVCAICGQEVSKRSTLSLQELGQGNGRACRTHDEVASLINERQIAARERIKTIRVLRNDNTSISRIASLICLLHTLEDTPISVIYDELESRDLPDATIKAIKTEVTRLGGPLVTMRKVAELKSHLRE